MFVCHEFGSQERRPFVILVEVELHGGVEAFVFLNATLFAIDELVIGVKGDEAVVPDG